MEYYTEIKMNKLWLHGINLTHIKNKLLEKRPKIINTVQCHLFLKVKKKTCKIKLYSIYIWGLEM